MKRYSSNQAIVSPFARRGFTLTEVLLVLAIIGVIAAMVIPNLIGQQKAALIKQTRNNIAGLESSAMLYAQAHDGEYARDINSMMSPGQGSDGKATPAVLDKLPKDSWSQPLFYEYPNSKSNTDKPAIWSAGPNKQNEEGGGDDINNWTN